MARLICAVWQNSRYSVLKVQKALSEKHFPPTNILLRVSILCQHHLRICSQDLFSLRQSGWQFNYSQIGQISKLLIFWSDPHEIECVYYLILSSCYSFSLAVHWGYLHACSHTVSICVLIIKDNLCIAIKLIYSIQNYWRKIWCIKPINLLSSWVAFKLTVISRWVSRNKVRTRVTSFCPPAAHMHICLCRNGRKCPKACWDFFFLTCVSTSKYHLAAVWFYSPFALPFV